MKAQSVDHSAAQSEAGGHIRGMIIMVMGVLLLPFTDAIGKWMSTMDNIPPATVAFLRFAVQCALTFVILLAMGGISQFRTSHLTVNLVRGALIGFTSLCFFMAIKYMSLADATAIFFAEPLILTIMSAIILKEKIGWRRYCAVTVGLVGTLIVIQPSFEVFGAISLLPLLCAVSFATYLILNRKYGVHEKPLVMQFYAGIGGGLTTAFAMLIASQTSVEDFHFSLTLTPSICLLIFLLGSVATVGHLMVVQAFKLAPASILAPFQYLEIVTAVILGLLLFGDFPTPSKWLGIMIIIGSGIYVFMRERNIKLES
ncbi:DMT family transporter [Falsochrobactrum ovis]|uniref:EamA domain-containing membrane protein RarD n=1 Tax=Falsochrobactrum ovis TaxID=1293442 RepID=A0A364JWM2_9HYPH|nr:DMT family transporter [Falsochrobactrum ovis]RAK31044.1 EamA domain-containing membrane protein RarD [Falsochrobactrum ovis]